MKKLIGFIICCSMVLCGFSMVSAQVNNLNEPGSLLVYPLVNNLDDYRDDGVIDNFHTIIEIANLSQQDVWVECYAIMTEPVFEKKNFFIFLTQKQPFWWDTRNGITGQIPSFRDKKGFIFCWAVDSDKTQEEITWNYLKGDALVYTGNNSKSFQYNAIPHQRIGDDGVPRNLSLDGNEYTMATSQIMFEGFAEGFSGIYGELVVASLDIDFILSIQPEFDINFECWNEDERPQSRHLHFYQFEQYDLTDDLQLDLFTIGTPKWQCAIAPSAYPVWAVFFEYTGGFMWGSNVFQHPATGAPATVILPAVPLNQ